MGLLDRFRNSPPPATTPRGGSGRGHYQGFLQLDELNTDLAGPRGLEAFDRMWRTDPDVRRVGSMMINPLLAATWTMVPHGEDEAEQADRDAADFVRWALFESMRPRLFGHLAEALPVLIRSGFAPFEQVWHTVERDGRQVIVPRKLGLRLPRTIHQFVQDDYGDLTALVQQLPVSLGLVTLPADDLLYYRVGAEGDNWEGTSLFRPAYKSWFYKDKLELIDAIAQEREATGYAVVYPPTTNVSNDVLDDLDRDLEALRSGDAGRIIMPGPHAQDVADGAQGWRMDLVGYGGTQGGRSAKEAMEYHRDGIAASLVAEFMRLGQAGEGARATADVQQDPFLAGVEALAEVVQGPINEELIPRICALNLDVDEPPKLRMSLVDSTSLNELATFVTGLIGSGALTADPPLEDFLRKRGDLPAADPVVRREREAAAKAAREQLAAGGDPDAPDDEKDEDDDREPVKPKELSRADRVLRPWEAHMELDAIEGRLDQARDELTAAGSGLVRAFAVHVADCHTKPGGCDCKNCGYDTLGPLEGAIADALEGLYQAGRATVRSELDRQAMATGPAGLGYFLDQVIALDDGHRWRPALRARARLAARQIREKVQAAIERLALTTRDQGALQATGETAGAAALRVEGQVNAAAALNAGRTDEADDLADRIRGARYTSILDMRRCRACKVADDDVLRPLADPVRLARRPPNPACEGGDRCRCLEAFELAGETAPDR